MSDSTDRKDAVQSVCFKLEQLILDGHFVSNMPVPKLSMLAEQIGEPRALVGEAVSRLRADGLFEDREEGLFISGLFRTMFAAPVAGLVFRHPEATDQFITFRMMLDGFTARTAAECAHDADLAALDDIYETMVRAHAGYDPDFETDIDMAFHQTIAEATHNLFLLHTLHSFHDLMADGIRANREMLFNVPGARDTLFEQHTEIYNAVMNRQADAACDAARRHVLFAGSNVNNQTVEMASVPPGSALKSGTG